MSIKNFKAKSFLDLNADYLGWIIEKTVKQSEKERKYPLQIISTAMCHDGKEFYLIVTYNR